MSLIQLLKRVNTLNNSVSLKPSPQPQPSNLTNQKLSSLHQPPNLKNQTSDNNHL